MNEERAKRKLSAILSANVKGYTRLMGEDELGTMNRLKEYRQVTACHIQTCGGRVVDAPGDNILSEFTSVVDAVQCAVEIHEVLRAKNQELPEERRMLFLIVVKLGDVIEEGDRIKVEPITDVKAIAGIKAILKEKPSDLCLSTPGINTSLRASDLLSLRVGKVKDLKEGYDLIISIRKERPPMPMV